MSDLDSVAEIIRRRTMLSKSQFVRGKPRRRITDAVSVCSNVDSASSTPFSHAATTTDASFQPSPKTSSLYHGYSSSHSQGSSHPGSSARSNQMASLYDQDSQTIISHTGSLPHSDSQTVSSSCVVPYKGNSSAVPSKSDASDNGGDKSNSNKNSKCVRVRCGVFSSQVVATGPIEVFPPPSRVCDCLPSPNAPARGNPIFLPAGTGPRYQLSPSETYTLKASAADTCGKAELFEISTAQGYQGLFAANQNSDAFIYVAEGSYGLLISSISTTLAAGGFAYIKKGTPFGLRHAVVDAGRIFGGYLPPGTFGYFAETVIKRSHANPCSDLGDPRFLMEKYGIKSGYSADYRNALYCTVTRCVTPLRPVNSVVCSDTLAYSDTLAHPTAYDDTTSSNTVDPQERSPISTSNTEPTTHESTRCPLPSSSDKSSCAASACVSTSSSASSTKKIWFGPSSPSTLARSSSVSSALLSGADKSESATSTAVSIAEESSACKQSPCGNDDLAALPQACCPPSGASGIPSEVLSIYSVGLPKPPTAVFPHLRQECARAVPFKNPVITSATTAPLYQRVNTAIDPTAFRLFASQEDTGRQAEIVQVTVAQAAPFQGAFANNDIFLYFTAVTGDDASVSIGTITYPARAFSFFLVPKGAYFAITVALGTASVAEAVMGFLGNQGAFGYIRSSIEVRSMADLGTLPVSTAEQQVSALANRYCFITPVSLAEITAALADTALMLTSLDQGDIIAT